MIKLKNSAVSTMEILIEEGVAEEIIYQHRNQYPTLMGLTKEEVHEIYDISLKVRQVREGTRVGAYTLAERDMMINRLINGPS